MPDEEKGASHPSARDVERILRFGEQTREAGAFTRRFSSFSRARGRTNAPVLYRVASAIEGSSELICRKIGVPAGSSTFEPFVMNASQSFFAAPKYPNPIAVPTDACAAPAPSKPKPFRPSPDRDHAVFCRVLSATALDGPISEAGARSRATVEVVALISPSLPTSKPSERSA